MYHKTEKEIMQNWKEDKDTPLVSICTITYNHENFIVEALDSFLMQETNFPFEIVIDDDCSPDGTVDVIKQYMEKYPKIMNARLREKNVGSMTNFMENMQRAKGKYIAICEGDDYWTDPLKIQKQVDFLEENDEYVLTYSRIEAFNENGKVEFKGRWATWDIEALDIQKRRIRTLPCAVCFRNVDILKDFPFEYRIAGLGDQFLWPILGAYGKGKFLEDIKVTRYRLHSGGIHSGATGAHNMMMDYLTNLALFSYYRRIGNIPLSEFFHKKSVHSSFYVHGRWYYIKNVLESIKKQIKKKFFGGK